MNDEIIVNFTPTGLIPTKEQTEFVPISCNEIVEDVLSAYEEGITTVHLHARHEDGSSAYEAEAYAKIIEKIRKYTKELVICVSLSGRNVTEFEKNEEGA